MKYQSQPKNRCSRTSSAWSFAGKPSASRSRERGVALVITLIMLSVITFLTVAFLALSRRDRASVTTSLNQTDAHLMADTALARLQTEVTARMMAQNSLLVYDAMVTSNYINAAGFEPGMPFRTNVNNVNYDFYALSGVSPLNAADAAQNIANLFYDPRPPVFIKTNSNINVPLDFRFYLDYNRNRRFETNGFVPIVIDELGTTNGVFENVLGEPEWIGVLQNPEFPHSATNRFIGRYLYLALPIGKTLDWNHIHNYAKGDVGLGPEMPNPPATGNGDGFSRNQGVGSWELNLGGFLQDLNVNMYPTNPVGNSYQYFPAVPNANVGIAFNDAVSILSFRYGNNFMNLSSFQGLFPGNGTTAISGAPFFQTDLVDGYSTAPILTPPFANTVDPDFNLTANPWSGSNNETNFYEPQELFDPNKTSPFFVERLTNSLARTNSYDRYTFSRLLGQIGTGSEPEVAGKININYANLNNLDTNHIQYRNVNTNFVEWTPLHFFTNAAQRLISDNLLTNVVSGVTNVFIFNTNNPVNANFALNNIQIYPTNCYTPQLHRLLQVAANVYDATQTNRYPSVFRPLFGANASGTNIVGYSAETNANFLTPTLNAGMQDRRFITNLNGMVWGVPMVIGAKKGFPNFNKFVMQTSVQISRNLQIRKTSTDLPPITFTETNQMMVLGISNVFGIEAWNSYFQSYTGRLMLLVTNTFSAALTETNKSGPIIWPASGQPFVTNYSAPPLFSTFWPGTGNTAASLSNSFVLPLGANSLIFMTNSQYMNGGTFRQVGTNLNFEVTTDYVVPSWVLSMTNRLLYILIDVSQTNNQRIVDFVNLDGMESVIDLSKELLGSEYASRVPGTALSPVEDVWLTNRLGGSASTTVPTEGMEYQIRISMGEPDVLDQWTSYSPTSPTGPQKNNAIDNFRKFMGFSPAYNVRNTAMPPELVMQTPFNPTRKLDQTISWQVNDPLVHYMTRDLIDTTNAVVNQPRIPPTSPPPSMNLKSLNNRYRPWGGKRRPYSSGLASQENFNYDMRVKDPGIRWSDDWSFPTNKFASLGWLGRVHRGTPWQTLYLKAADIATNDWAAWSGHVESHPPKDWKIVDAFTTSVNDNAARGLLSINQTNLAAWSAALSGVVVLTNAQTDQQVVAGRSGVPQFESVVIQPNSTQLLKILNDINGTRQTNYGGLFRSMGDILSVPSLSVAHIQTATNSTFLASPFLNVNSSDQRMYGLNDEAYERIPRQILSLLKLGEPRFVVYSYGQSLKPAPNSLVLTRDLRNLCTNYQVTGEMVTRTIMRVEGTPQNPKTVIESYNVLSE